MAQGGFRWCLVAPSGIHWQIFRLAFNGAKWLLMALSGFKWMVIMSEKQASYRVNFTMPKASCELNSKINELFERHREIGTLRHWLMSLATEAAREELGIMPAPPSATPKPTHTPTKPKKTERFTDLLPDAPDDNKPMTSREKSKELEAYDSLRETIRTEDGYDSGDIELDEALESGRPIKLSNYK